MAVTGKIKTFFSDIAKTKAVFPRTKVKAVSDDNGVGLNVLLANKMERPKILSLSLPAANWVNDTQTVSADGVTSDIETNYVEVFSAANNHIEYHSAGVYCSAQGDGTLTFTCMSVPECDLKVHVKVWDER